MGKKYNSPDEQKAISEELAALHTDQLKPPEITEAQSLNAYLENFDKYHSMAMQSDRSDEATSRLLIKGCEPAYWLKFALKRVSRPYDHRT